MPSAGMPSVSSGRRTARFTLFGIGTIRGLKTEVPFRVKGRRTHGEHN
jgi:hypothetical protein